MMGPVGFILGPAVTGWRRIRRGSPGRLALRLLAAAAVSAAAVAAVGWQPASAAVITGILTVFMLTAGKDLAGPSARCSAQPASGPATGAADNPPSARP